MEDYNFHQLSCHLLENGLSVASGGTVLKSFQNLKEPKLDLLVREVIQNSSDASLKDKEHDYYQVSFNIGEFTPCNLNRYLEKINSELNRRFPGKTADFIAIRDYGSGLTGPVLTRDLNSADHGNFYKLIYDIGKEQTQDGAGGNWGFGKSVYYQVGIGLVVFYSRIKVDETYEERLIVNLTENDSDVNNSILHTIKDEGKRSAGRAWWGKYDGEDFLPITDPNLIAEILDVFHLAPYKNNETGTAVIIPYLKTKECLDEIVPNNAEDDGSDLGDINFMNSSYGSSVREYLKLAIQRWYFPVIHNFALKSLNKKWLKVYVNGDSINKNDLIPYFRLFQNLYVKALSANAKKELDYQYSFDNLSVKPITIQKCLTPDSTAGQVAFIKTTKNEIFRKTSANENGFADLKRPYIYLGEVYGETENAPILMYAREPGMVIEYAITGDWVKKIHAPENNEEYIFAFFVPDTNPVKKIRSDYNNKDFAGRQLSNGYLRNCEGSDHFGWSDRSSMDIVRRIQQNIGNNISRTYRVDSTVNTPGSRDILGDYLGRKLFPNIYKNNGKGGSGSGGSKSNKKELLLGYQLVKRLQNQGLLDISLQNIPSKKKTVTISFKIASEGGSIDEEAWKKDIKTKFPISIIEFSIESLQLRNEEILTKLPVTCNKDNRKVDLPEMKVTLWGGKNSLGKIVLDMKKDVERITGKLSIKIDDKKYSFTLKAD